MYKSKKQFPYKAVFITLLITGALLMDVFFGTASFPILTSIVCAIVVIYECVSPFIYSSR
jgi:hypothetical protein